MLNLMKNNEENESELPLDDVFVYGKESQRCTTCGFLMEELMGELLLMQLG